MKYFTLVEIVLALMVAAVGIIGIMALFPVGLSKNKETVMTRSAADAADQFLHTMAAKIRKDWEYKHVFPDEITGVSESSIIWSDENILKDSNIDLYFAAINNTDVFNYIDHTQGIFQIKQITPGNHVDFDGVIRSWKVLTIIEDPRLNGDIMPWGLIDNSNGTDTIGYGFTNGEEYTLKQNAGNNVVPGNFGCINFSGGGGGANAYLGFIQNGGINASIGGEFPPLPGNMAGPTVVGVQSRLDQTPYIRIPVVTQFQNGANSTVTILKFLPFKLVAATSSGNGGNAEAKVTAIYIGNDSNTGEISPSVAEKLTLHAEVSYPLHLDYSLRKKEVFSITLFKGGQLTTIE